MSEKQSRTAGFRRLRKQSGVILLETLVGVAVISTTVLTGLVALSTASIASDQVSEGSTASWLIVSEMEIISTQDYVAALGTDMYQGLPVDDIPAGFTVENTSSSYPGGNSDIQVVTITVSKGGEVLKQKQIVKVNR